jgi:hypothetical protein
MAGINLGRVFLGGRAAGASFVALQPFALVSDSCRPPGRRSSIASVSSPWQ